jgi:hypothetical protein
MKRSFSLLILAVFALGTCETRYYSITLRNNSSKQVTYTFDDITDTLAPIASKDYQVKAYTQPPKDLSVSGAMSVKVDKERQTEEYVFKDIPPTTITILNTLPVPVRVKAGKYIEDIAGNPFIECQEYNTSTGASETTGKIFTNNPVFQSVPKYEGQTDYSDYPVIFDWKITVDGKIAVTIR